MTRETLREVIRKIEYLKAHCKGSDLMIAEEVLDELKDFDDDFCIEFPLESGKCLAAAPTRGKEEIVIGVKEYAGPEGRWLKDLVNVSQKFGYYENYVAGKYIEVEGPLPETFEITDHREKEEKEADAETSAEKGKIFATLTEWGEDDYSFEMCELTQEKSDEVAGQICGDCTSSVRGSAGSIVEEIGEMLGIAVLV